jgi:hypothetical protein
MKYPELILNKCEVDDCDVTECLHKHHWVERTEKNTTNHPMNLVILCPTHHNFCHLGKLKIIGLFPSTKLPNKRTLVYELDGVRNVDIEEPYIKFVNKSFKI